MRFRWKLSRAKLSERSSYSMSNFANFGWMCIYRGICDIIGDLSGNSRVENAKWKTHECLAEQQLQLNQHTKFCPSTAGFNYIKLKRVICVHCAHGWVTLKLEYSINTFAESVRQMSECGFVSNTLKLLITRWLIYVEALIRTTFCADQTWFYFIVWREVFEHKQQKHVVFFRAFQ